MYMYTHYSNYSTYFTNISSIEVISAAKMESRNISEIRYMCKNIKTPRYTVTKVY